jgi:hypothetical protein
MWAAAQIERPIGYPERDLGLRIPVSAPEPLPRPEVEALSGSAEGDLAADREFSRLGPRELRLLPGIGQTRALAIARERWNGRERGAAGGLADLVRIPGIGPQTQEQVRQWFRRPGRAP